MQTLVSQKSLAHFEILLRSCLKLNRKYKITMIFFFFFQETNMRSMTLQQKTLNSLVISLLWEMLWFVPNVVMTGQNNLCKTHFEKLKWWFKSIELIIIQILQPVYYSRKIIRLTGFLYFCSRVSIKRIYTSLNCYLIQKPPRIERPIKLIFYTTKKDKHDTHRIKPLNYTFTVTSVQTVRKNLQQ